MSADERAMEIFRETEVLQVGHFKLSSGRHSDKYMQCANVFKYPWHAGELCAALADKFRGETIDIVIGPAVGAVQMAYEVSRHLNCRNMFAEREDGRMALRRSFRVMPGERVLLVEDTVTTGGSVKEVAELVRSLGGVVVGVGALVDRSGGKADFGCPFYSVASVDIESWDADSCPLCARGEPIIKPGSKPNP